MLGHSERRVIYEETDTLINEKIKLCLDEGATGGLSVILCVGETEEEYDNELLASVVDLQIRKGLMGVSEADLDRVVIAYEPVWAIGTGKVATPEQAQLAHVTIRRTMAAMYGAEAARSVRIQYGGSVTPDSIEALMKMPDIDGALVGGASLIADSFTRIVDGGSALNLLNNMMKPAEFVAKEVVATKNVLGESPVW
jgi:triosephosphate isomerase